ncbi:MAG TPA: MFS transporter [Dehalococcoidia bacterium]|nr:MFS transporter [Dehalococcoidia bacterium]
MTQSHVVAPAPTPVAARPRIFYGWWMVLGAMVALFVSTSAQGGVSGIFLRPMSEDLGWTRAQFTIATSLGTGVSGLIGFFIGGYVDRVGARPLMVIGITIVGGTLLAVSQVQELWQFIVLRGVVFTIGFVLVGNLVVNVTVSKWFVERRGWAISMASLGFSASSIVTPLVMVPVVDALGWRDAWVVMGVVSWVLVYPVALIMRREPEDFGLLPDGKIEGEAADAEAVAVAREEYASSRTRGEAVRTLAMWLLIVAFGFAMVGLISLIFHSIPFLTDNGYSRSDAALIVAAQGGSAIVSKFAWGWAMQYLPVRGLVSFSFVMSGASAVAMVPVAATGSLELMVVTFVLFGWGIGGMVPLSEVIWAQFFGRRYLGAVRSAGMPVTIIFSATGPFVAGAYYDAMGSYNGALITFAALWFIAAGLVMLARQPKPKAALPAEPLTPEDPAAFFEAGATLPPTSEGDAEHATEPVAAVTAVAEPPEHAAAPPPSREPPPAKMPMIDADPEHDPPPPEPSEATEMQDAAQEVGRATPADEASPRPTTPRPRDYMTEDEGTQSVRDYMRQQIDVPRERPANGSTPASSEPAPEAAAAPEAEPRAEEPVAAEEDRSFGEEPNHEPHDEPVPMPEEPPQYDSPPERERERADYGPPSWEPAQSLPFGERWTAEPSVNLGQATRAIQRRLPSALSYYRQDGVSSAVWAGVATSVVVTAAVWLLTRGNR